MLYSLGDSRCSKEVIFYDLNYELGLWVVNGKGATTMGDFNEDTRKEYISKKDIKHNGMREVVLEICGSNNIPPTHHRESASIGGTFKNAWITPTACRYLEFGRGFWGDHRIVWLDVTFQDEFGGTSPSFL